MNRRSFLHQMGVVCGGCALAACQQGILKPLGIDSLVGEGQMRTMSLQAWEDMREQIPLSRNRAYQRRVEAIGRRLVAANGFNQQEDWEFRVFEGKEVNAFALAGGKVGVNDALMKAAGSDDDQVAAVVGHEIGHVVARHPAQRYSNMLATGLLAAAVQYGLSRGDSENAAMLAQVFGTGLTLGAVLPFSREHEYEADALGVRYMHAAQYDMAGALRFWQKSLQQDKPSMAEYASTHPSSANRLQRLEMIIEQQKLWDMAAPSAAL